MEVMGLMLGEFVDEYTVRVIDVFAMPQSGTVRSSLYLYYCVYVCSPFHIGCSVTCICTHQCICKVNIHLSYQSVYNYHY